LKKEVKIEAVPDSKAHCDLLLTLAKVIIKLKNRDFENYFF
jgi:hypothetical protein